MKSSRVCLLPPLLANQISAGEVVERPASVVKELVENSLDAGAQQIEIELEEGGVRLIRVIDDGVGIHPDDMALSLARHATSKITSVDDLQSVQSLGFRGEALASIASVSRLSLTSCRAGFPALMVQAEGPLQQALVKPAAHPVGTRVEVEDLFFNTPARRKFLKSERTEISHVEEWLRRMALARPNVAWSLRHNRRQVLYWPGRPLSGRLAQVLGSVFVEQARELTVEKDGVSLQLFLADGRLCRLQPECFSFVNGRAVRDRLIQHALRQAATEVNIPELAGVLFIELAPERVDVNVHPTKHEVRFRQARWLHDFLLSEVIGLWQEQASAPTPSTSTPESAPSYPQPAQMIQEPPRYYPPVSSNGAASALKPPALQANNLGRLLWLEPEAMGLIELSQGLWVFNAIQVQQQLLMRRLQRGFESSTLISQPVLIPRSLTLSPWEQQQLLALNLSALGIAIEVADQRVRILQWPALLRSLEPSKLIDLCRQRNFAAPDAEFWQSLAAMVEFQPRPNRLLDELEALWPEPASAWGRLLNWSEFA